MISFLTSWLGRLARRPLDDPALVRRLLWMATAGLIFGLSLGLAVWSHEEEEGLRELGREHLKAASAATMASVRSTFASADLAQHLIRDFFVFEMDGAENVGGLWSALDRSVKHLFGDGAALSWQFGGEGDSPGRVVRISEASGRWVWRQVIAIRTRGAPFRVILDIDDRTVMTPLELLRPLPRGQVFITDQNGRIMGIAPARDDLLGLDLGRLAPDLVAPGDDVMESDSRPLFGGVPHVVSRSRLDSPDLTVFVAAPEDELQNQWWREGGILLGLYGLGVPFILAAAYWLSRMLDRMTRVRADLELAVASRTASLEAEMLAGVHRESALRIMREAVDASISRIVIANSQAAIEYANPAHVAAVGARRPILVGRPLLEHHMGPEEALAELRRAVCAGQNWQGETLTRRHDGAARWTLTSLSPIRDGDGVVTNFVLVEEDVSAQHSQADELRAMRDQAESANRAKDEFLSSMSHELRTPLNAILGFGQLLLGGASDNLTDRQKGYARAILKGGVLLLDFVNEVLDLASIKAGKLPLSPEPVDLSPLVADCVARINDQAREAGIAVENLILGESLPWIRADRKRLAQALSKLLDNAVKYSHAGGMVRVEALPSGGGRVRVLVSDSGVGIEPDREAELFQPFSHLGEDMGDLEGPGVGLAITKRLVEAMGGSIGHVSEPGRGAVFWLELPTAEPGEREEVEARQMALPMAALAMRALYVEDSPSSRALMAAILERDSRVNWTLETACTAEEGLAMAERDPPDVIIMDVNLPGMSGIEAMRALRRSDRLKSVPVLGLSADVMPETVRQGLAAGFRQYIQKPLKVSEFPSILLTCAMEK